MTLLSSLISTQRLEDGDGCGTLLMSSCKSHHNCSGLKRDLTHHLIWTSYKHRHFAPSVFSADSLFTYPDGTRQLDICRKDVSQSAGNLYHKMSCLVRPKSSFDEWWFFVPIPLCPAPRTKRDMKIWINQRLCSGQSLSMAF